MKIFTALLITTGVMTLYFLIIPAGEPMSSQRWLFVLGVALTGFFTPNLVEKNLEDDSIPLTQNK